MHTKEDISFQVNLPHLQGPAGTQHSTPFLGHLQSGPHLQSAPAQPLHTQIQQSPVAHLVQLSPHWQSGPHLQLAVEDKTNKQQQQTNMRLLNLNKYTQNRAHCGYLPLLQGVGLSAIFLSLLRVLREIRSFLLMSSSLVFELHWWVETRVHVWLLISCWNVFHTVAVCKTHRGHFCTHYCFAHGHQVHKPLSR